MDKKEYFRKLINLYEAEKKIVTEAPNSEQNITPSIIPQTDQLDVSAGDPSGDSGNIEESPGLDDADYLSAGGAQGLSPMDDMIEVSEQKRLVRLFDLFKELMNYSIVFYESLDRININLLDEAKNKQLKEYKNKIFDITEKLKAYIKDSFVNERYEKALYVYILLRTELITIIKLLRESLDLNHSKENTKKAIPDAKADDNSK
jgi:hypothetical protein